MGVMAGSVYDTLRSYGGFSIRNDHIHLNPALPSHWRKLAFKLFYRNHGYAFNLSQEKAELKLIGEKKQKTEVAINGKKITITSDKWNEFPLR